MLVLWSEIWAGYILAFVAETKWSWLFPPSLWTVQYNFIFLPLVLFLCWNLLSWITHHWCLSCMVQNSMKLSLTSLRAKFMFLQVYKSSDSCGPWEWSYGRLLRRGCCLCLSSKKNYDLGSLSKFCEVSELARGFNWSLFFFERRAVGCLGHVNQGPNKKAACACRN